MVEKVFTELEKVKLIENKLISTWHDQPDSAAIILFHILLIALKKKFVVNLNRLEVEC